MLEGLTEHPLLLHAIGRDGISQLLRSLIVSYMELLNNTLSECVIVTMLLYKQQTFIQLRKMCEDRYIQHESLTKCTLIDLLIDYDNTQISEGECATPSILSFLAWKQACNDSERYVYCSNCVY